MFCQLTKKKLIKRASVLEKHVNGKKFKKLMEEYKRRQEKEKTNGDQEEEEEIDGGMDEIFD